MNHTAQESAKEKCHPECDHLQEEHDAFDTGLKAGEAGLLECPHKPLDSSLAYAWFAGAAVGATNKQYADAMLAARGK